MDQLKKELCIARSLIESQKTVINLLYELLDQRQPETFESLNMKVVKLPVESKKKNAGN